MPKMLVNSNSSFEAQLLSLSPYKVTESTKLLSLLTSLKSDIIKAQKTLNKEQLILGINNAFPQILNNVIRNSYDIGSLELIQKASDLVEIIFNCSLSYLNNKKVNTNADSGTKEDLKVSIKAKSLNIDDVKFVHEHKHKKHKLNFDIPNKIDYDDLYYIDNFNTIATLDLLFSTLQGNCIPNEFNYESQGNDNTTLMNSIQISKVEYEENLEQGNLIFINEEIAARLLDTIELIINHSALHYQVLNWLLDCCCIYKEIPHIHAVLYSLFDTMLDNLLVKIGSDTKDNYDGEEDSCLIDDDSLLLLEQCICAIIMPSSNGEMIPNNQLSQKMEIITNFVHGKINKQHLHSLFSKNNQHQKECKEISGNETIYSNTSTVMVRSAQQDEAEIIHTPNCYKSYLNCAASCESINGDDNDKPDWLEIFGSEGDINTPSSLDIPLPSNLDLCFNNKESGSNTIVKLESSYTSTNTTTTSIDAESVSKENFNPEISSQNVPRTLLISGTINNTADIKQLKKVIYHESDVATNDINTEVNDDELNMSSDCWYTIDTHTKKPYPDSDNDDTLRSQSQLTLQLIPKTTRTYRFPPPIVDSLDQKIKRSKFEWWKQIFIRKNHVPLLLVEERNGDRHDTNKEIPEKMENEKKLISLSLTRHSKENEPMFNTKVQEPLLKHEDVAIKESKFHIRRRLGIIPLNFDSIPNCESDSCDTTGNRVSIPKNKFSVNFTERFQKMGSKLKGHKTPEAPSQVIPVMPIALGTTNHNTGSYKSRREWETFQSTNTIMKRCIYLQEAFQRGGNNQNYKEMIKNRYYEFQIKRETKIDYWRFWFLGHSYR